MITRHVLRAAAVSGTTMLWLGLASPAAHALTRDDGDQPGRDLPALQTVLLFVVTPLVLFLVIALLAVVPSLARGPRYRPGLGWGAEPVWFGGPADPKQAITQARPTEDGGGASARW